MPRLALAAAAARCWRRRQRSMRRSQSSFPPFAHRALGSARKTSPAFSRDPSGKAGSAVGPDSRSPMGRGKTTTTQESESRRHKGVRKRCFGKHCLVRRLNRDENAQNRFPAPSTLLRPYDKQCRRTQNDDHFARRKNTDNDSTLCCGRRRPSGALCELNDTPPTCVGGIVPHVHHRSNHGRKSAARDSIGYRHADMGRETIPIRVEENLRGDRCGTA